jgi:PadR family transcriptional regulator AphA
VPATELTTTSVAMLGMLAIRPWSTCELAKHVDRSLGPLLPRARGHLHSEPKKLVAHGLAVAAEVW